MIDCDLIIIKLIVIYSVVSRDFIEILVLLSRGESDLFEDEL